MAAQHVYHLGFGRAGIAREKIGERHEDAGSAESALQGMIVLKRPLQRIEGAVWVGERFHGRHRPVLGLNGEGEARAHGRSVEQDRATSAYAVLAPDMGSGR